MAYVYGLPVYESFTATSRALTSLPTHSSGDLLLVCMTTRFGATFTADTGNGWALIGTRSGTPPQNGQQQWMYKVATSGSETPPTVTASTSSQWLTHAICVKDADTSSPINVVSAQTDWGTAGSTASATPTSTSDGCLVFYSWSIDSTNGYGRIKLSDATKLVMDNNTNTGCLIAYKQQESAGATDTVTAYIQTSSEGGTSWVFAIKNSSGGAHSPKLFTDTDEFQWYGNFGSVVGALTWRSCEDATDKFAGGFASAALDSISVNSTVLTVGAGGAADSRFTTLASSLNTAGAWVTAYHDTSANLLDKHVSVQMIPPGTFGSGRIGSKGVLIGFSDGTNYELFRVFDISKGWTFGQSYRFVFVAGQTTPDYSRGTLDWENITQVAYLWHRIGSSASTDTASVRDLLSLTYCGIVGGGENRPVTPRDLYSLLTANTHYDMVRLQGTSQVLIRFPTRIGNGGTDTIYYKSPALSVAFEQGYSATVVDNWQNDWNVPVNATEIRVNGGASDTIDLGTSVFSTDTRQLFVIDSSSDISTAVYSAVATSLVGFDVTWKTGVTADNMTIYSGYTVDMAGESVTNGAVLNSNGTAGLTISESGAVLTGYSIDVTGTGAAYHLELGTSVTAITLTDVTFSGTPGTDKVHVLATTGTVTITISGTTSLVAGDVTSAGATVVIAAPELYQSVTISGLTSGTRVQIYDTTAATELANSTQASPGSNVTWASATAMTWTDPVAAAADRTIRVRIAYVSGTSAKGFIEASIGTCGVLDGTEAVSYLANQVDDAVYNANGIDGPSIYATSGITFTDSGSNDRINCNIGGGAVSWGTIYACFAYWMSTSTGIADDIAYVTAVDTANYLLDSLKIKNTSATPLTITGGWGRDATSLTIADCIDTAGSTGNIFPQPDHVVAYATGSGSLTAGDITNIWSNGSRTLTTTIPSAADNANAVADVAVDGSVTLAESLRLSNSILGGKVSGAGTGTEVFRSLADDKDRATVTVDSSGNRSVVVRDLT